MAVIFVRSMPRALRDAEYPRPHIDRNMCKRHNTTTSSALRRRYVRQESESSCRVCRLYAIQSTGFDVASAASSMRIHEHYQIFSMVLICYAVEDMLALYDGRQGSSDFLSRWSR